MKFFQVLQLVNQSTMWRLNCRIGDHRLKATTFDRLLYLYLHRFLLMGSQDRSVFQKYIKNGMNVIDVGANLGLYSLFFSELVGPEGKVFAFEPDTILFNSLKDNLRLNGILNVEIFNFALGSEQGKMKLYCSSINSGDNRLTRTVSLPFYKSFEVNVERLDTLLKDQHVDFVKIDVQGWEFDVLQGMNQLLHKNSSIIVFFEFWPEGLKHAGREPIELLNLLKEYGFTIYKVDGRHEYEMHYVGRDSKSIDGRRWGVNLIARRN